MKIFSEITGNGPSLVLLHGWTHDHHSMAPLVKVLSKHYTVHNFDIPGAGQTEWSSDIQSVDDAANCLAAEIPGGSIIIGWSWGGAIAMSLAANHPEKANKILIFGAVPRFIEDDNWPGVPKPGFSAAFVADSESELIEIIKGFYAHEFEGEMNAQHAQLLENLSQHGIPMDLDVWRRGLQIIDQADLRASYKTITCPIHHIIGELDEATPVDWNLVKALNSNVETHWVKGAKHMPMWTHPEAVEALLKEILEKQ